MYGIIDIGSNTMRLSCYRVADRELLPAFHKKAMAGLAGYVDNEGCLSEKGIKKAIEILEDFKNIVMCVGLDAVYIIATASFRNVENTEKIVEEIFQATGLRVQVLSGKEEALYDFIGASYYMASDDGMVVDIGGGSTELVCFQRKEAGKAVSVPIGSLNMFSRVVHGLFPEKEEEMEIRRRMEKELSQLDIERQKLILGVGGTNRACLKLYNDYYDLSPENTQMECSQMKELLENIGEGKKIGMKRILKIVPDRIHTILPGMIILDEIMTCYKSKKVQISAWGVREGYMIERVL